VSDVLARVPAPRVVLLEGSVPLVTMAPFGEFLASMGYPDQALRDPRTGDYSMSSYANSAALAGVLAWHYERDGVRPLVIGHSQGGMLAVRVLHELAGSFADAIEVVDPATGQPAGRTTIRDPLTDRERPVVGLVLPYATAIATGRLFRVLLGQWSMLSRLSSIPDTVEEFTGFFIPGDPIAAGATPFESTGAAKVRNVTLPAEYSHIGLPRVASLATDPKARAWLDAYVPDRTPPPAADAGFDATNAVHAADVWNSVKRHWCREAQRLAAARTPP
jgi:pimeloyl-ACP methyl ester carboxylesterase